MRVRARSVSEGKRKCPGFRNTREIRFFLRVWMDVFVGRVTFAQRLPCPRLPLLFLPFARETLRKEENQVYRVSIVCMYTYIGKNEIVYPG